ncbi:MAG: phytoene desaturase family protein, partial [Candidatus Hinthialibacter sp.]
LPYLRPAKSVDADLRSFFQDERIRLAFSFQSKYLGMSPFTCPSLYTILSYFEYEYGIFHPVGGCGAVSQAMMQAAQDLGAEFFLSEPVTEIAFDDTRARGVVTASGAHPCDGLVINADFSHAMKELVPNSLRKRWSDKGLQKKKYSCSTFMIYLGVNRQFPDLHHHNIFLSDVYQENLTDIERDHRLSDNPSFYVCNPCVTDPGMAPPGKSALYILAPVTHMHENVDWKSEAQRYRNVVLRQLEKIGVRGLESAIEYELVLTPSEWESDYAIYKGAVFNLAHSLDQALFLRPQNRFKELDGVYLVGGGTHPGSGLPVIYESARITSRLIERDLH